MASRKSQKLCCVGGRYRRTIGKFVSAKGTLSPKKFLLGTDRGHAERANLRLEQLWQDIEKHWKEDATRRACDREPIWEPLTLGFAESLRKGERITLRDEDLEERDQICHTGGGVAGWYWWIRATYPSIADVIDEPTSPIFLESRRAAASHAEALSTLARHQAELAQKPTAAAPPGHTLQGQHRRRRRGDTRPQTDPMNDASEFKRPSYAPRPQNPMHAQLATRRSSCEPR